MPTKRAAARAAARFATTHRNIAKQRKAFAAGEANGPDAPSAGKQPTPKARRLANQEAAIHFGKAAEFFRRHAKAVTVASDRKHGKSLWQAALNFNKAQRWKDAIDVYRQYIKTRPDDPRRLKAINRLGKAFLADGQYQAAVERFQQLLQNHPNSPQAFASLVPLACVHLGLGNPREAVKRLRQVVGDHPSIRPGSATYRQALIELGKLNYRLGQKSGQRYARAIETLTEAVKRYGTGEQGAELHYLLADSYRRSADVLERELQQRQSQRARLAMQKKRRDRLAEAQKYFNKTVNLIESRPTNRRSDLEKLYHRNAYFYQADCAFDRGQYRTAIDLYEDAARKWEDDPASLVALVQIVNAHCELEQYQEAGVYNRMALDRLKQIPEGAFDRPDLPMSREHWEDWLRWTSEQNLFSGPDAPDRPTQANAG